MKLNIKIKGGTGDENESVRVDRSSVVTLDLINMTLHVSTLGQAGLSIDIAPDDRIEMGVVD